jgi:hypothetical protein
MGDTVAAMRRALGSAGVTADELAAVLLVGGSSRIPLVGELVGQLLGRPVAVDAHPKHLVAMGAARHAAAGGVLAQLGGAGGAGASGGPITVTPPAAAGPVDGEPAAAPAAVVAAAAPAPAPVVAPPDAAPVVAEPAAVAPAAVAPAAAAPPAPSVVPSAPTVRVDPGAIAPPTPTPTPTPPSGPSGGGGVPPTSGAPIAPGRRDAERSATSTGARKPPIGLIVGAVAVVAALVVGLVLVLGGGGGDDGGETASEGNGAGADCPTSGPFVCITEVSRTSAGGLQASFRPVELQPSNPGSGGRSLVFFLADVVATDHGLTAVSNGAPIEWGATQPFQGWTSDQLAARSVVCALVVESGAVIVGSGNCRPLP